VEFGKKSSILVAFYGDERDFITPCIDFESAINQAISPVLDLIGIIS
jgi:hypothetical protein